MTLNDIYGKYFSSNPSLGKAHYAYHDHQTVNHNAHRFPSGLFQHKIDVQRNGHMMTVNQDMPDRIRYEACIDCGRSRYDVRWDDLPGQCLSADARPSIQSVVYREEANFLEKLEEAQNVIPDILKKKFSGELTSESLFYLQSTTGYNPDIVAMFVEQNLEPLMPGFDALMDEHKRKSGPFKGAKE
jgi:hypothetical protein